LSIVGAGGVVAYAWYDSGFRRNVEDRVPYSKEAFGYIFQYLPASSQDSGQQVIPVDRPSFGGLKPTGPLSTDKDETKPSADLQQASSELGLSKEELESLETEERKRREKEKTEQSLKLRDAEVAYENKALESKLERMHGDAMIAVESAMTSLRSAALAIREHTQQLRRAMEESGTENEWQFVPEMRTVQADATWMSDIAAEKARSELDRLRSAVADGKSNVSTQKNKLLLSTEEELNRLSYELSSAAAQLSKAQSEAKIVSEYRNLIRRGREQFRKELESIVPDVKIGQRLQDGQLTEDELNSLIAHAHRRIEQLQKQLAEQQAAEQQRMSVALEQQKAEDSRLAEERVEREKERMKAELSIIKQKWDEESHLQFERDLRTQLSRQAAAHSDHLTEVLHVQQKELEAAFHIRLSGRLDAERAAFQRQVAIWIAKMRGIDKALGDRAEADKNARLAQELWLACQTLQSAIANGRLDVGDTWEERLKPLGPELEAIKAAAAVPGDSELISTIIATVPETAISRGVWTEAALVERFSRVRSIARRVAFIDDAGGSLFRYLLSYMMSVFVVRHSAAAVPDDAEIAIADLTPFVLLDRASSALDRGDLEQAVRYVNQLTGEPRRVASDWLREARLLLETRLAADALITHAVAMGLESLV
jgi:mitofilin